MTSYLTHWLFKSVPFNSHIFVNFLVFLFHSFVMGEYDISILKYIQICFINILHVLDNVTCVLKKNECPPVLYTLVFSSCPIVLFKSMFI